MLRKTVILVVVLGLLAALLSALAGCPPQAQPETPVAVTPAPVAPNGAAGAEITQTGSTTVLPIAQKWQATFNKQHPEINIAVSGGGSGTGIKALIGKTCNIADSSRKIKDEEVQQAKAAGVNPQEIPIAYDGIAVIVSKDNPLSEISLEKLSEIYSGTVKSWDGAGASGLGDIQVVARDSSSGTYESFKEMAIQLNGKAKDRDYTTGALQQASNEAVLQTVAQTKGAIGYIGLGYVNDKVKVLKVLPAGGGKPGVLPNEKSVRDNSYTISRMLYVYTDGEPTGALKTYLDWCISPEGQALVKEVGYIALSPEQMWAPVKK